MRTLQVVFTTAVLWAVSACGGGGYSVNPAVPKANTKALTAGNWWIVGSSNITTTAAGAPTDFSGPLTVSGSTVSVTSLVQSQCFPSNQSIVISGPSSGANVTIATSPTASHFGFVLTIQGTNVNGTVLDGTYQVAGGTNGTGASSCKADVGTVYGTYVPPLSEMLVGSVTETLGGVPNVASLNISLSQGTTAATFVTDSLGDTLSAFSLSGGVTWTNATCFGSGVIDPTQSYIAGNKVMIAVMNASGNYPTYTISSTLNNAGSTPTGIGIALSPGYGPCGQSGDSVVGYVTSS